MNKVIDSIGATIYSNNVKLGKYEVHFSMCKYPDGITNTTIYVYKIIIPWIFEAIYHPEAKICAVKNRNRKDMNDYNSLEEWKQAVEGRLNMIINWDIITEKVLI